MAEVLKFDPANPAPKRARKIETARYSELVLGAEAAQDFWLISEPQPADPANSQGRVLLEMLAVLGATAAVAFAISLLIGAPPV